MRVEGAAGTVGLTLSVLVVCADEGLGSHFGITQNPMNSCLLALQLHSSWLVTGQSLL